MIDTKSRDDGPRPVVIDDSLIYPLLILTVSMLLVPQAAGTLLDGFVGFVGLSVPDADYTAVRTAVSLIAQGAALVGLSLLRVSGAKGLRLPPSVLGLPFGSGGVRSASTWKKEATAGVIAGFGVTGVNILGSWLTQRIFGLFMDEQKLADYVAQESRAVAESFGAGSSVWIVLLLPVVAVVVAPIAEELFFRGYLYAVLRSRFVKDSWYALYWSSAVFAIVHFYVIHFVPVFLVGLALGYLYRKRRNLIAPVVAHATANFVVTVVTLLGPTAG